LGSRRFTYVYVRFHPRPKVPGAMSKAPFDPDAASEIRDLRTGRPLWASSRTSFPARPLHQSAKADVVIVGAGITGALLAHTLATRGLAVIVLDRREPAHGS